MPYVFPGESEDLEAMLDDSLHSITLGDVTRPCFYELRSEPGEEAGGGAAQVLQVEVATIKADHFPDIAEGDTVTIAEADSWHRDYAVVRVMPAGAMKDLVLQEVP